MKAHEVFNDLCKKHNTTPYQVGKKTGISQSTLSEWHRGLYTPKIDKLVAVANYFEVPVTVFIEGYGDGKVSS